MAHLTHLPKYNIEDSNIALFGSDIEKRIREHAGDKETAWEQAGIEPGLQIWRIEHFKVEDWPKERYGSFYDGDSYIILHTYKKDPEAETLSYDLHFWLGEETSQDEAGTAAYKTVELDDHLNGRPVQHREVQSYESARFLSYFPAFHALHGGVSTGFHHVQAAPLDDTLKLYRIGVSGKSLLVREVTVAAASLAQGDVFVLDQGAKVWQLNTRGAVGKEKFKAAEFVQGIVNARHGACESTVYDEGGQGVGVFLSALGAETVPARQGQDAHSLKLKLFRFSDDAGVSEVSPVSRSALSSSDVFFLDALSAEHPAVYVWIGSEASGFERRKAFAQAQKFLQEKGNARGGIAIMREGEESSEFAQFLDSA
ncbi:fragmin60 [Peniophora sp. CONT]|nr:fragmin60 [Peniophora sp. CONT]